MNNFGFGGMNNENPLMQYLKQYATQQPDNIQPIIEPQRGSGNGALYEINCQADIDYIEIDKSGRIQIFNCPNEKRVYTRRYNHSKQKPDYKEYIEEEETKLSQKNDTSAEMSQIAEALVAVANKLETMHGEIQELKNIEPKIIESIKETSNRKPNGQFKKKGEE